MTILRWWFFMAAVLFICFFFTCIRTLFCFFLHLSISIFICWILQRIDLDSSDSWVKGARLDLGPAPGVPPNVFWHFFFPFKRKCKLMFRSFSAEHRLVSFVNASGRHSGLALPLSISLSLCFFPDLTVGTLGILVLGYVQVSLLRWSVVDVAACGPAHCAHVHRRRVRFKLESILFH